MESNGIILLLIIITKIILRILKKSKHYVKKRLQRWQNISKSYNRGKINLQTNPGGMTASRGETEPCQRADLKLRIDLFSVFTVLLHTTCASPVS